MAALLVVGLVLSLGGSSWGQKTTPSAVVAQSKNKRLGWDLDDTLFDTRYRTQASAFAFAKGSKDPSVRRAAKLAQQIDLMGHDGESTAKNLGLEGQRAQRFAKHWNRFFWDGRNLKHDRPIPETIALVQQAAAAGKENYFITGRTRRMLSASLAQLRDAGLPDADREHLMLKQNVGIKTLPFKIDQVQTLGVDVYGTDSAREASAIQALGKQSLWVDFPTRDRSALPPAGTVRIVVK